VPRNEEGVGQTVCLSRTPVPGRSVERNAAKSMRGRSEGDFNCFLLSERFLSTKESRSDDAGPIGTAYYYGEPIIFFGSRFTIEYGLLIG
jgi:hypothetical protein